MKRRNANEFLVALLVTAPLVSFQFFYIVLAVFAVTYFARIYSGRYVYQRNSILLFLFALPFIMAILLSVLHREQIGDPDFSRTLELCLIFSACVFVFDAVGTFNRNQTLDLQVIAVHGMRLLAILLIGKLVYTLVLSGWDVSNMIDIRQRRNPITDYNPNHVDDYFLLFLVVLCWFLVIRRPAGIVERLSVLMTFSILVFLVVQSGSVGGALGVGFGLCVLIMFNIRNLLANGYKAGLRVVLLACMLVLGTGVLLVSSNIGERVSNMIVVSSAILEATEADGDIAKCDPERPNAMPVIAQDYAASQSLVFRMLKYDAAFKLWQQSPWIGYGVFDRQHTRTVEATIGECVFNSFAHVHNLYLDVVLRGGVLLLVMIAFFACVALLVLSRDLARAPAITRGMLLSVLFFFCYLALENLFDLTFILAAVLKVNLLVIMILWAISRTQPGIALPSKKTDA